MSNICVCAEIFRLYVDNFQIHGIYSHPKWTNAMCGASMISNMFCIFILISFLKAMESTGSIESQASNYMKSHTYSEGYY